MATPEEVQLQNQMNDELRVTNNTLTSIANNLAEQFKLQQKIGKEVEQTANDYYKDLARTLKATAKDVFTISENQESISRGALRSKVVQDQINKAIQNQNKALTTFELLQGQIGELSKEELQWKEDAVNASKEQLEILYKQLAASKQVEKIAGLTGKIFEGIAKIPLIGHLVDTEKILENVYETAAKTGSRWAAFGSGLATTFNQIGKKMMDPVILFTAQIALFKKFYSLYGEVNQRVVEQGRQLNINKEQSQALYESASRYAAEQRNAFVTESRILEGRSKLNAALGTSITFTNQEAITAEKLSHYYGINEEQNAHLATLAREIGQTNNDLLNTVIRTTNEQKRQFGGTLSQQKILQKVSSVSGEILTKFKGNVSELTKAVMQADRLGLTLEQVDKVGESLLNFEQSIEAELKAELLTGKAINLEKARAAALSGDTVKLTSEIAKQVGNIHQFEKMNTLQRQAYAEAFGMTAGEMGDMLRKREFEAKLGADAKKSAEEQLRIAKERGITIDESVRKDLEAKSLAELQKYTFEKIRDILAKIASGPMTTIYNLLEKGFKFTEKIFGNFSKMTGGNLGNALGAAILGAPLLLGAIKGITGLFSGGLKGMFFQRGTALNPMITKELGGAPGAGGGGMTDMLGGGFGGKRNLVKRFGAKGARNLIRGAKGFGVGMAVDLGANLLASGMEEGSTEQAITEGVGTTAGWAGTGAMVGSFAGPLGTLTGAIVGGLGGAIYSWINYEKEKDEKERADKVSRDEAQKQTNELLQQMAVRPLELNVNNDTIGKWNTYSSQNGANSSFS